MGGHNERSASNTSFSPSELRKNDESAFETHAAESGNASVQSGVTMDDLMEAQKFAKYAVSALSYEDVKTAIDSMNKAIAILKKYDQS